MRNQYVAPLTAVEHDLADEYPARGEVQLDAHPLADAVVQLDGHVARRLEDVVRVGRVPDRVLLEVLPAHRERDHRLREHLTKETIANYPAYTPTSPAHVDTRLYNYNSQLLFKNGLIKHL